MVFKIVYERPTFRGVKRVEVVRQHEDAVKLVKKCHKRHYNIINIEHI